MAPPQLLMSSGTLKDMRVFIYSLLALCLVRETQAPGSRGLTLLASTQCKMRT
jgi:hypothetical protein